MGGVCCIMAKNEVKTPVEVKTSKSLLHSIEDHDYWISRIRVCPYCRSGSKPVHKSLIVENVERR